VFGLAFSVVGLFPSMTCVDYMQISCLFQIDYLLVGRSLFMVCQMVVLFPWCGGYVASSLLVPAELRYSGLSIILQWVVASLFVLCIGMSIAELASAAPTAGGVSGVHNLCIYFDSLQGLLLDPHLCFTSLAKPTFLDSRL